MFSDFSFQPESRLATNLQFSSSMVSVFCICRERETCWLQEHQSVIKPLSSSTKMMNNGGMLAKTLYDDLADQSHGGGGDRYN
ncbi:hypothetical protein FF2_002590 [Malus domestica]